MDSFISIMRIAPCVILGLAPLQLGLSVYFLLVRKVHRIASFVAGVSAVGSWATIGALILSDFPASPDPDASPFGALIAYAVLVEHHVAPYLYTIFGCGIMALVSTIWMLMNWKTRKNSAR